VIHVFHRQVDLILVAFSLAAVLGAAVRQNAQQRHVLFLEEGQHTIVEQICSHQRILSMVKLREGQLRIGIEEGLNGFPPA